MRALKILPLAALVVLGLATPVMAQDPTGGDPTGIVGQFLPLVLLALANPIVSGLATKAGSPRRIKVAVSLGFALLAGVLHGTGLGWGDYQLTEQWVGEFLQNMFSVFGVAQLTYWAVNARLKALRPTGLNGYLAPHVGL